jgi:hypothetical protein
MGRVLRVAALGIGLLATMGMAIAFAARFHDGPLGPFPGGPFQGAVERGPEPDWSFLDRTNGIDLEVDSAHPRSVHVWVLRDGNAVYVPSAFAAKKKWPAQVVADPRVRLRVGGRVYERRAARVTDAAEIRKLIDGVSDKYHAGHGDPESTWFFRLDPPAS